MQGKGKKIKVLFSLLFLFPIILYFCYRSLGIPLSPPAVTQITPKNNYSTQAVRKEISAKFWKSPLHFEANCGQSNSEVKYLARGAGYELCLTDSEAILSLGQPQTKENNSSDSLPFFKPLHFKHKEPKSTLASVPPAILRMSFVGANTTPEINAENLLPAKINYFLGKTRQEWRTNISTYSKVRYKNIYPGIDLIYYGKEGVLEYDFVVAPEAKVKNIVIQFQGAKKVNLDEQGNLILEVAETKLVQHAPTAYQDIEGQRQKVECCYVLLEKQQVGFEVGRYDKRYPLVIDPVLEYSLVMGSSGSDLGLAEAIDAQNNVYIMGQLMDQGATFVNKFSANGVLLYTILFGQVSSDMAVSADGQVCLTGYCSENLPLVNAFQASIGGLVDAFVTKFGAGGTDIVFSTYFGGNELDYSYAIAVDKSGSVCITGSTQSPDLLLVSPLFPRPPVISDDNGHTAPLGRYAFIAKFNATGTLTFSTYLGGTTREYIGADGQISTSDPETTGTDIAVDTDGNIYTVGYTRTTNFPTTAGVIYPVGGTVQWSDVEDGFITKISSSAALVYSTYLKGNARDCIDSLAVDSSGNVCLLGATTSSDFPTVNAAMPFIANGLSNAFVVRLNSAGSAIIYSTAHPVYVNAYMFSWGDIATDATGNAYIVTYVSPDTNMTAVNAFQPSFGGGYTDAVVSKLTPNGVIEQLSYLGGSGNELGAGISVDSLGNIYVVGFTNSQNFPAGLNQAPPVLLGGMDAFLCKIIQSTPTTNRDILITDNSGSVTTKETSYHYNSLSSNKVQYLLDIGGDFSNTPCLICQTCTPSAGLCSGFCVPIAPQAADPVHLNNLEFTYSAVDLEIPGRGINYRMERHYRSRINFDGPIGKNWDFTFNMRIVPHPTNSNQAILYDGKGRGDSYTIVSGAGFVSPSTHFNRLIQEADNALSLRQANGTIFRFLPLNGSTTAGKLSAIITRCGNRLLFEYNAKGEMITVIDSLGRHIEHYWEEGHLVRIVDFLGREVVYTYNEHDQLISVRSPVVSGTPNGNEFSNGKEWQYSYSTGFDDETLNNNLLTVTAPNEVAANGSPHVVNYFNDSDCLIRQDWGGTNSSGVQAGGSIYYAREVQNEGVDPTNTELAREVVTVVDRNGNETVFTFNCDKQLIQKEEKTRGIRTGDPDKYTTLYKYTSVGLLKEQISPEGNRVVYEYDETNADVFQQGNILSVTTYPNARGAEQEALKVAYQYEPVFNQVWKVTEPRGNDAAYQPQNGGANSAARYTTEYVFDYFEGGLDTPGCTCGYTLRQLKDKFGLDISSIESQLNQGDLNGDGAYGLCGNLIMTRYPKVTLRPESVQSSIEGGTIQTIERRVIYNKFGQVERIETPEGEVTLYVYYPENDPEGDGQDILTGNNASGQAFDTTTGGYMKEVIRDQYHSPRYRGSELPKQLGAKFGYTAAGNIAWTQDARGIRTSFTYNQLNQIVEVIRASDVTQATETGLSAYAYKTRIYYDYNNNVVKTESQYRDGNNASLPQWLETTFVYDILDKLLETTQRVDSSTTITQRLRYDANENLIESITPASVSGLQPNNKSAITYDERDLVYQVKGAPGTSDEAVVTYVYDKNGSQTQILDSQDNNGDGQPEAIVTEYDGFNRVKRIVDAVGNEAKLFYDPASNVIKSERWGTIGGSSRTSNSTTGNILLSQSFGYYDELSRVYQSDSGLFVPQGATTTRPVVLSDNDAAPGDGKVTSFLDYDRNSRVTFATAASPTNASETTRFEYDGLSRLILARDADGNQVTTEYDRNSNVVRTISVERNSANRIPNETFVSLNVYDSMNRLIRTTSPIGQTRRFTYDSRNLLIKATDAQGAEIADPLGLYAGNINGDGNATEIIADGLGRALQTIRELRQNGQGSNPLDLSNASNPDGKIVETHVWDVNSRLVSVSDDKANVTAYQYDNLNRLIRTTFADGLFTSSVYDKDSQLVQFTDQNGTVTTNAFDGIGRLIQRNVTRSTASNVQGTTLQTFEYDGLSRLTKASDNNNPDVSDDDAIVERKYDSLSRLVEEIQNGKVISYNWTQSGDPVDLTYPGGRKLTYTLDRLNRLRTIADSQTPTALATYDYIGGRLIEKSLANGTKLTTLNDAGNANEGYDTLGRLVKMRHVKGTSLIAGFGYSYNRENMHTAKEDLAFPNLSEVYSMDSVYRVVDFQRGTLNATKDGITGTPVNTQTWQLDGVGNWAMTAVDGIAKTQTINAMNEYDAFAGVAQVHDDNGNLTDDGNLLFVYDFANRIVEARKKADNGIVAKYSYDSFNRRTSKKFLQTREEQIEGGEYATDANTLALYHFNETAGRVTDSSGNKNHGIAPPWIQRGVEGLWDTKAVDFSGLPILVANSGSLQNVQDKLTVETWVYLKSPECNNHKHKHCWVNHWKHAYKCHWNWHKHCPKHHGKCDCEQKCRCKPKQRHFCPICWLNNYQRGSLIAKPGSYELEITKERKALFTLFTTRTGRWQDTKATVKSNEEIPLDQWVHIAGVYDGAKAILYVDGVRQTDDETITGNVKKLPVPLMLGSEGFQGKLEETRISNIARTSFGNSGGTKIITETVLRNVYYNGWQTLEWRERIAQGNVLASTTVQFGEERLARQFVDGFGIDEHIRQDVYDDAGTATSYYYHANYRGDTVAITDDNGNPVQQLAYSAYGEAYTIGTGGALEALSAEDADLAVYTFQGRELDVETGTLHFRNRQYSVTQGRFFQRDPLGYVDGLGLYEFEASSPENGSDPYGLFDNFERELNKILNKMAAGAQSTLGIVGPAIPIIAERVVEKIEEIRSSPMGQFIENTATLGGIVFGGSHGGKLGMAAARPLLFPPLALFAPAAPAVVVAGIVGGGIIGGAIGKTYGILVNVNIAVASVAISLATQAIAMAAEASSGGDPCPPNPSPNLKKAANIANQFRENFAKLGGVAGKCKENTEKILLKLMQKRNVANARMIEFKGFQEFKPKSPLSQGYNWKVHYAVFIEEGNVKYIFDPEFAIQGLPLNEYLENLGISKNSIFHNMSDFPDQIYSENLRITFYP